MATTGTSRPSGWASGRRARARRWVRGWGGEAGPRAPLPGCARLTREPPAPVLCCAWQMSTATQTRGCAAPEAARSARCVCVAPCCSQPLAAAAQANNGKERKDLYSDNWDGDVYKGACPRRADGSAVSRVLALSCAGRLRRLGVQHPDAGGGCLCADARSGPRVCVVVLRRALGLSRWPLGWPLHWRCDALYPLALASPLVASRASLF
jgi:hypothetical protein